MPSKPDMRANMATRLNRGGDYVIGLPPLPACADALPLALRNSAQQYLSVRRQGGEALLTAVRLLSEARALAVQGEWEVYLEAIGLEESRARAQIRLHEKVEEDPTYAEYIRSGWLSEAVARELLPAPAEVQQEVLSSGKPPTLRNVRATKRALTPAFEQPLLPDMPAPTSAPTPAPILTVHDPALFAIAEQSYSADRLSDHKMRKPFAYDGRLWIGVSSDYAEGLTGAPRESCVAVVPVGTAYTPGVPNERFCKGRYCGDQAAYGGVTYELTGQWLIVQNNEAGDEATAPFWQSISPNHPTAHLWTKTGDREYRAACGMTSAFLLGGTDAGHCSSCVRATWKEELLTPAAALGPAATYQAAEKSDQALITAGDLGSVQVATWQAEQAQRAATISGARTFTTQLHAQMHGWGKSYMVHQDKIKTLLAHTDALLAILEGGGQKT